MKSEPLLPFPLPGIVYSYFETRYVAQEEFIGAHGLCYILAGTLFVVDAGETRTFGAGELVFYRKNFLAKFIKQPAEQASFEAITVVFDPDTLRVFSQQYGVVQEQPYVAPGAVLRLENSDLLTSFYATLQPYFHAQLPVALVALKKCEALLLLLQAHPDLKNVLFDFSQPGKIDLEAFIQQNFRFNVEAKQLAYLTGRSLATFKRDFDQLFHLPPHRWLRQKRLEEAHYLLKEKNMRPSEVYHTVGFETLAHFSSSFKQFFGHNPSRIPAADSAG